MKLKLLFISLFCVSLLFAASSSEIRQDLNQLMTKINQINSVLNQKQNQRQVLTQALNDSEYAIGDSTKLLGKLQHKRALSIKELTEIDQIMPKIIGATDRAESNVKDSAVQVYKQLLALQSKDSASIFSTTNSLESKRKKTYLINILLSEQKKYQELSAKLDQIKGLSMKIEAELDRLDLELGTTSKRQARLQHDRERKQQQAEQLLQQITRDKQRLETLKQQQAQLNKLLGQLTAVQSKQKALLSARNQSVKNAYIEDNSAFFSRKLNKPVDGIVIVAFSETRSGLPSNGILFKADKGSIYAVSHGKVLYTDKLPGFGQMIVIDHGDKYVSIYGGVLPTIKKNQVVKVGQVIANAGSVNNQPMGGVYFELRHLGNPVDPTKLIKK
jgi:murein hydrolase activator